MSMYIKEPKTNLTMGDKHMNKRTRRKLNRIRGWVLQILALIALFNLFLYTPAIKFGQGTIAKFMTVISCVYLFLFIAANIDS